jgi:hypothetical protein
MLADATSDKRLGLGSLATPPPTKRLGMVLGYFKNVTLPVLQVPKKLHKQMLIVYKVFSKASRLPSDAFEATQN